VASASGLADEASLSAIGNGSASGSASAQGQANASQERKDRR